MAITFEQMLKQIQGMAGIIAKNEKRIQTVASKAMEGRMKRRIFNLGNDAEGRQIGRYSQKEAWFSQDSFAVKGAFKNIGKKGTATKSTQYFVDGYKGLREEQGFQAKYVDLDYTGSLRASLITGTYGNNVVLGISSAENIEKADSLEKHFGKKIFEPTDKEIEENNAVIINEIDLILRSYQR